MLDNCDLSKARVFVIDQTSHGRREIRNALSILGFHNIEDTSDVEHSSEMLATQRAQLIVAAVQGAEDPILQLVQDIRQLRQPGDPFLPIMLNVWSAQEELVDQVIGSGADDLLIWPFSVQQLGVRVRTLINARKKFVATEKYFGPDRRSRTDMGGEDRGIQVPNALRAFALSDRSALPSPDAIIQSMSSMLIEKIHYESQSIEKYTIKLDRALLSGDPEPIRSGISDILQMLESVKESADTLNLDHLVELIGAVGNVLRTMASNIDAIGEKQRILLSKTTRALAMAAKMDDSVGSMVSGISAEIRRAEENKFHT